MFLICLLVWLLLSYYIVPGNAKIRRFSDVEREMMDKMYTKNPYLLLNIGKILSVCMYVCMIYNYLNTELFES